MKSYHERRLFGLEIEFYVPPQRDQSEAFIEPLKAVGINVLHEHQTSSGSSETWLWGVDPSLFACSNGRGYELKSPPMPFSEASFDIVRRACAGLQAAEAFVNKNCALQVHHDIRGLGNKKAMRIQALYQAYEKQLNMMMPVQRRNFCNYAKPIPKDVRKNWADPDFAQGFLGRCKVQDRGCTVEYRQHEGTVDAAQIINWVRLTHGLTELALCSSDDPQFASDLVDAKGRPQLTLPQLIGLSDENLMSYVEQRRAYFEAPSRYHRALQTIKQCLGLTPEQPGMPLEPVNTGRNRRGDAGICCEPVPKLKI